jgi:hypothetical protein
VFKVQLPYSPTGRASRAFVHNSLHNAPHSMTSTASGSKQKLSPALTEGGLSRHLGGEPPSKLHRLSSPDPADKGQGSEHHGTSTTNWIFGSTAQPSVWLPHPAKTPALMPRQNATRDRREITPFTPASSPASLAERPADRRCVRAITISESFFREEKPRKIQPGIRTPSASLYSTYAFSSSQSCPHAEGMTSTVNSSLMRIA